MDINVYNPLGKLEFYVHKYEPNISYGPSMSKIFVLYYVLSGKGEYSVLGKTYKLEKGHLFTVQPDFTYSYNADKYHPWELAVIIFDGALFLNYIRILDLSPAKPILKYKKDDYLVKLCRKMLKVNRSPEHIYSIKLMGLVLLFFGNIMEQYISNPIPMTRDEMYVYKSVKYIQDNYAISKITVNEISNFLGLERSYFSKIFKNIMVISPQKYIVQFKINKACEILANTDLGFGYISNMIGYSDYFAFSKAFKNIKGVTPFQYRKSFSQKTI